MNNPLEIRAALSDIIQELRQPLPVYFHQIRELKGGEHYIFLPWWAYRDRLQAVAPDYEINYRDFATNTELNLAIVHCEISILGIKKSQLGSVPISELSSKGNEMTRGDCLDRARAEALKNTCEEWGVGWYVRDQYFCAKYLESAKHLLLEGDRERLNKVRVQLQSEEKNRKLKSIARINEKAGNGLSLPGVEAITSEYRGCAEAIAPSIPPTPTSAPTPTTSKPEPKRIIQSPPTPPTSPAPPASTELAPQLGLYPRHDAIAREFCQDFNFPRQADYTAMLFREFYAGKAKPSDLDPEQFSRYMVQIAAAWAHENNHFDKRNNAYNALNGKLQFIRAAQGSLSPLGVKQLCLEWRDSLTL